MKRIDRYLMKEMIAPFLISTVVVVMMFQANQLMAIYRDPNINMDRVPFLATLQLLLLKTPAWLQLTLPFGIALGSSLCVSRIARESELVAMRSAGIPIRRVLRPVIIAGILAALLNFVVTEQVMPRAEKASKRLLSQIGQLALQPTLKSNVSVTIGGWIASIGTVSRGPGGSLVLDRVLLNQKDYNGEETVVQADK
ncbi:MAG: LptF/LptG family permease, partial [Armatimonadetes bacterium]|nr:LptF/LptG family permease [Armatimonadota bacterium]